MDAESPGLEQVLKRDRHIVIGALVLVSLASWLYILTGAGMDAGEMAPMSGGAMLTMRLAWTPAYFALMLAMWWVMMVAMMLPSAAPLVLLFATAARLCSSSPTTGAMGLAVPSGGASSMASLASAVAGC